MTDLHPESISAVVCGYLANFQLEAGSQKEANTTK